jgi:hypothetical protein
VTVRWNERRSEALTSKQHGFDSSWVPVEGRTGPAASYRNQVLRRGAVPFQQQRASIAHRCCASPATSGHRRHRCSYAGPFSAVSRRRVRLLAVAPGATCPQLQYTIRGISSSVGASFANALVLVERSLNQAAVDALTERTGIVGKPRKRDLAISLAPGRQQDHGVGLADQNRVDKDRFRTS